MAWGLLRFTALLEITSVGNASCEGLVGFGDNGNLAIHAGERRPSPSWWQPPRGRTFWLRGACCEMMDKNSLTSAHDASSEPQGMHTVQYKTIRMFPEAIVPCAL